MTIIAVILTIASNYGAGMIAGRLAGMSPKASLNVGFTLVSRGEFSIIMANIGKAGGLMASIQSFAVLYVLILVVLAYPDQRISTDLCSVCAAKEADETKGNGLSQTLSVLGQTGYSDRSV